MGKADRRQRTPGLHGTEKDTGREFSNEKGVDMFDVGEGKDRVHLRVSKNPDWYQDFYGAYGRAPNRRELYDIAQEKIIAENDKGDEESKAAIAEIEEAKRESSPSRE